MSEAMERRVLCEEAEVRAEKGDDGNVKIRGYAAVFNTLSSDLGGFRERLHPTAFDAVLRKNPDVRGLFNHDPNYLLGRTRSGTLRLYADEKGLGYTIDPPKSRTDVLEALERGDVTGSSFAFTIARDGEEWVEENGKLIREVRKVAGLFDVGPVVYPAYPDTTAARRSLSEATVRRIADDTGCSMDDLRRRLAILAPGSR